MNPVKVTLFALGAWIGLTVIYVFLVEDTSEIPFEVMIYSCYLMPVVCLITFVISSFFYRSWVIVHKKIAAVALLILVLWILLVVLYIRSLFA